MSTSIQQSRNKENTSGFSIPLSPKTTSILQSTSRPSNSFEKSKTNSSKWKRNSKRTEPRQTASSDLDQNKRSSDAQIYKEIPLTQPACDASQIFAPLCSRVAESSVPVSQIENCSSKTKESSKLEASHAIRDSGAQREFHEIRQVLKKCIDFIELKQKEAMRIKEKNAKMERNLTQLKMKYNELSIRASQIIREPKHKEGSLKSEFLLSGEEIGQEIEIDLEGELELEEIDYPRAMPCTAESEWVESSKITA